MSVVHLHNNPFSNLSDHFRFESSLVVQMAVVKFIRFITSLCNIFCFSSFISFDKVIKMWPYYSFICLTSSCGALPPMYDQTVFKIKSNNYRNYLWHYTFLVILITYILYIAIKTQQFFEKYIKTFQTYAIMCKKFTFFWSKSIKFLLDVVEVILSCISISLFLSHRYFHHSHR